MGQTRQAFLCLFLSSTILVVMGDSTFAGSAMTSDSRGTKSVLVSGRNGVGVVQTRFGGGGSGVSVGSRSGVGGGTYASTGNGGAISFAGPTGAYAGPGGAYASAGAGPWAFPYWNGAGSGAYASAGASPDYYPYYDDGYPSRSGVGSYGSGGGVGVYSSSDSNGIQTRFANVAPGGQATIVEQNGNEPPKVYTYRGVSSSSSEDFN